MGLMDKVKGLLKGREKQVKSGIDTVSNAVEKEVGPKHAAKVDAASDKAKEAVDKLSGTPTDRPARRPRRRRRPGRDAGPGSGPAGRTAGRDAAARRPAGLSPHATRGAPGRGAPLVASSDRFSPCRSTCP